jgi:hypothetical protein
MEKPLTWKFVPGLQITPDQPACESELANPGQCTFLDRRQTWEARFGDLATGCRYGIEF